jgi:glycine/D-amino acid oxidase-like deaminating enzyme
MLVKRTPRDDEGCGWWNLLPAPPPARHLEGDTRADCAVVGAGFTGLAAARQLALLRPDWRIALVEAQRAGYAASGRNSGFVGAVSHRNPRLGLEGALCTTRLCRSGTEALRAIVDRHRIDCQWAECGRIHAAVESHGLRNFDDLCGLLDSLDEAHEVLDRARLEALLGTGHYRVGAHIRSTVLLQPAALARGLADALPANVDLYEESPVQEMGRRGAWHLRTRAGTLTADRVLLAVNGFAPGFGVLRRRVFPLVTFASLSRVLDPAEQRAVGEAQEWGLVSEDRMGTTLRRTRDQRILVRSTVHYLPSLRGTAAELERACEDNRRSLLARWPALEGVAFEFTWGGVLGMTGNQGQFFGRLDRDLYASAGYNGTGVALGTASGMALAEHALGEDSELVRDALALPHPFWLPPEPLLGWGVRCALGWLRARAGAER